MQEATCNMQVATELITTARKAAAWTQLGVVSCVSIKQMQTNHCSIAYSLDISHHNMDDDKLDQFATVAVTGRQCCCDVIVTTAAASG